MKRVRSRACTMKRWMILKTQLILQTLFDIKADVRDIHDVILWRG
jgi:hypothetical protein